MSNYEINSKEGDASEDRGPGQTRVPSETDRPSGAANVPIAEYNLADQQRETDEAEWYEEAAEDCIIGYECIGCGHTQASNAHWGGRCDRCDSVSLEPIYY